MMCLVAIRASSFFSALTELVGRQEAHSDCKQPAAVSMCVEIVPKVRHSFFLSLREIGVS